MILTNTRTFCFNKCIILKKNASFSRQEPQPAGTTKWTTTWRFRTSVVRSIQSPQDVVRYKNSHVVEEGGKLHILFIHDVSSKPNDQYISLIIMMIPLDLEVGAKGQI